MRAEFAAKEKISYIVYDIVVNALRDKRGLKKRTSIPTWMGVDICNSVYRNSLWF
jgi:hypothetical protein